MRYLLTLILCVHFFISIYAQSPRKSDITYAALSSTNVADSKDNNGNPDKKLRANAAQARKKIVGLFNLFKDYEIIVDTALLRPAMTDFVKEEPTAGNASEMNAADFSAYLDKTNKLLVDKLEKLEKETTTKDATYWNIKNRIQRALSILQSAYCLSGKERNGSFVYSKDQEGYDIICFPLDSLKTNPRYGTIDNYKEGFARIRKDQVYGFLNYCGDEYVTCQYQQAESFNYGRALVKKVDWYFIDTKGEESNTLENILDAKALVRGVSLAKFSNGKFALIDNNFDLTQTPISEYYDAIEPFYRKEIFKIRTGKKYGLLNVDGSVKLEVNYDKIEPSKQLPNVYVLHFENAIGLIDSLGNVKFKPSFTSIGDFNKYGLAVAYGKESVQLINGKTMEATKSYDAISTFNQFGLAMIRNKDKMYGIIDSTLNVVLAPTYTDIKDYNKFGLAAASKPNGDWGYINRLGKEIIAIKCYAVGDYNAYGLVVVRNKQAGCSKGDCLVDAVLDQEGRTVIAPAVDAEATNIRYFVTDTLVSNRYVAIIQNTGNKSGYRIIDRKGNRVVNKTAYEAIMPHDQYYLFAFRDNNSMWGLMDTTGKVVAKPMYKELKKPKEEYYPAQNEKGKWGFIDKKGKPQIPFEYEEVKSYRAGYATVSQGKDKWGLINKFNAKIVPCVFKSLNPLEGTEKYEIFDTKDNIFIINENGDCEKNCDLFESIRKLANSIEAPTKK